MVHIVDQTQRRVTLGDIVQNDADGVDVVDLLKVLVLHIHLAVDAVDALDAVADGGLLDAVFRQMLGDGMADLMQKLIAVLVQQVTDRLIADRVQIVQAAVLQLLLDVGDAEAVGDGRIDLHRFKGLVAALLLRPGVTGAHIVQPVAKLDDHDADILTHRQQHLAQVLSLTVLDIGELDLGQLGNAVNKQRDLGAELLPDLRYRYGGILRHIVHQGCSNALAVHTQLHKDLRHGKRMTDIRLAAAAALLTMRLAASS